MLQRTSVKVSSMHNDVQQEAGSLRRSSAEGHTGSVAMCRSSAKFYREFCSDAQLASIFG